MVALTSITGTVVDRYAYDAWGEPTGDDRTNETVPQQLRYRGYYDDEALTYYWVGVRYYDPEAMRWLQPDPSEQDGVRTYAYVANDPVDAYDPSGLCLIELHSELGKALNIRFGPLGINNAYQYVHNNDGKQLSIHDGLHYSSAVARVHPQVSVECVEYHPRLRGPEQRRHLDCYYG